MLWSSLPSIAVGVLCLANYAHSYVPAVPTNSTQDAIAGGLNVTDISELYTQWYPNRYDISTISSFVTEIGPLQVSCYACLVSASWIK